MQGDGAQQSPGHGACHHTHAETSAHEPEVASPIFPIGDVGDIGASNRTCGAGDAGHDGSGVEDLASEQKASKRPGTVKRPRCWRFSIGSAPLTSITKIDAQVRGGETRQDYKDTRRFPLEAPSCALLFRPCRLPDTCPPFSLREAWRFLIAHAVGISVRCRSFAPSWAVCTNPPFSPTAAPYPVTIVLSPTR